eukprot:7387063-Prymnesium_polylepis.1
MYRTEYTPSPTRNGPERAGGTAAPRLYLFALFIYFTGSFAAVRDYAVQIGPTGNGQRQNAEDPTCDIALRRVAVPLQLYGTRTAGATARATHGRQRNMGIEFRYTVSTFDT